MTEKEETQLGVSELECPWLIFMVNDVYYGVNTAKVQSIMKMPPEEELVAMPEAPEYIRNVVRIRENIVPTLDLRHLYGMDSVKEEYLNFKNMIDARKQDHVHWVEELHRSVQSGEEFALATDPHKCKFGQWYYDHEIEHSVVSFILKKVEEPHRKLHETALAVLNCDQQHESCQRAQCLKEELKNLESDLMPKILGILDEVKEVFHHRYSEKLIVLEDGARRVALIVDDVKAIDHLEKAEGNEEIGELMLNNYISCVGRGKKIEEMILMLDADSLLQFVKTGAAKEN